MMKIKIVLLLMIIINVKIDLKENNKIKKVNYLNILK